MKLKGFIDLHAHGFARYDTRTSRPEHILKLAEFYGKAGTSAFLPTIYSGPVAEMRKNMEAVRKAMEIQAADSGCRRKNALQTACSPALILGVHLEGPFLNPSRCGALDREAFIRPNLSGLKRLVDGYEGLVKIITVAPELPGALKVIEKCREAGFRINMGHSDATCKQALDGKKAGATGITHIFNAMRPFHHREPGLAGFGLMDKEVYIEVIADGVHLCAETLRLIFSIKTTDRIILVSDSVKGAGKRAKPVYKAGGILAGSGITLKQSADILRDLGIPANAIMKAGLHNPERFVSPFPIP